MTIASFFAYSVALGIAAGIPGPGVTSIVGRALGTGFRRTVPMVFGLIMGDLIYLALAIAGLAIVAETFSSVFLMIKYAGATYLIWLAWNFWHAGMEIGEIEASKGRRDGLTSFLAGLAVTLGNPKTIIFYLALLPTVIDLDGVSLTDFAVLCVLTVIVLMLVIMPYAALASRTRKALKNSSTLKALNRTAAAAMGATAAWILIKS